MMQRHFMWQSYQLRKLKIGDKLFGNRDKLPDKAQCRNVLPKQSYSVNFYTGCADMISVRLYDQFEAAQGHTEQKRTAEDTEVDEVAGLIEAPDPSKMRALVVVQNQAVSEKVDEVFPQTRKHDNYFDNDQRSKRAGYVDGVKAGSKVAINRLVN